MGARKKRSIKIILVILFCACVCCFVQPVKKCIVDALPATPTHEEVLKAARYDNLVRSLNNAWDKEEISILNTLGEEGIVNAEVKKVSVEVIDFEVMPLGIVLTEIHAGTKLEFRYVIFKYTETKNWEKINIPDEIGEIR
jgi:hypothetical protein